MGIQVELLAGVMVDKCGVKKGDRVLFYFPVIPQCLIAMLACTRIGAIYSLVYGGFPPKPISNRIQHTEVRLDLLKFPFFLIVSHHCSFSAEINSHL